MADYLSGRSHKPLIFLDPSRNGLTWFVLRFQADSKQALRAGVGKMLRHAIGVDPVTVPVSDEVRDMNAALMEASSRPAGDQRLVKYTCHSIGNLLSSLTDDNAIGWTPFLVNSVVYGIFSILASFS